MKTLPFILAFFCASAAVGQTEQELTPAEQAFEDALVFWEEEKPEEAIDAFRAFMKDYPHSPLRADAHFNIGYSQFYLRQYKEAASTFHEILNMEYNELADNNIMEPYKLYKHNSARYLAEISLEVKEWKDAERYIHMFDKEYPYQHFCGNEWAAYDLMKATMEARLHEGQGKIEEAVKDLVPHIFFNGLASNDETLLLLIQIIRRNYSEREIRTELESALASVKVVKVKREKQAEVILFGANVIINEYMLDKGVNFEEEAKRMVRGNPLFVEFLGEG